MSFYCKPSVCIKGAATDVIAQTPLFTKEGATSSNIFTPIVDKADLPNFANQGNITGPKKDPTVESKPRNIYQ